MAFLAFLSVLPATTLATLPLVAAVAYALALVVYRVCFHPLSKYPGPWLAKITDLHQTYHAWHGDRHLEFWRNHARYGDIVRFGPNSLSFNTSAALKDIYGFKANVRKADFYAAFPSAKDAVSTHSAIDKATHARKRRVLSQAFSDAAIKSMENHILAHIQQFCTNLGGTWLSSRRHSSTSEYAEACDWSEARNMSDQANYMTFDIMGDLCFGKAFGMLERPENRFAIDLIGNAAHRHLICGTYLPIHHYHLDKLLFRKIAAGRQRYMEYSKAQAVERMKTGLDVKRKDFFYHLLKARDPETGRGFSTSELWGESNLLIIAGSDTTSTALAATFFYLAHNRVALDTLTSEVRAAFTSLKDIRMGPTLSSLPYLRAALDEAMRLSPSVGGLLPRQILPGGATIASVPLPAGVIVGTPHYALHHNSAYFPDPFAYRPERWLANSAPGVSAETVAAAQAAFCPFSIGPRGCIGKGMAYAELSTALARALWEYDLRLAPGSTLGGGAACAALGRRRPDEFQLRDTFTSMKEGPMVQFRPRARDNLD